MSSDLRLFQFIIRNILFSRLLSDFNLLLCQHIQFIDELVDLAVGGFALMLKTRLVVKIIKACQAAISIPGVTKDSWASTYCLWKFPAFIACQIGKPPWTTRSYVRSDCYIRATLE